MATNLPPTVNYERLVAWFTHNMPMEMRHKLMAELPMEYHRLYPEVNPAIIVEAVRQALADITPKPIYVMRDMHTTEPGHYHDPLGKYDYCDDPACPRNTTG